MTREKLLTFNLPDEPGVYQFRKGRKVLYVGKATILKDRVRSYFALDIADTRSSAIAAMVAESDNLTWDTTESVLEALILEANTIKRSSRRTISSRKTTRALTTWSLPMKGSENTHRAWSRAFTAWRGED